eukprot:TRINITY_DN3319_c0_g3_i6.p1 TRINITY_DN3319_c0_g3~~TRINITY_DN3319_c0_g3_i6.p1  ORF type:complete len:371 (-),score=150.79 TRINITY_DN3319_c0_g3_i6:152-1183(-)
MCIRDRSYTDPKAPKNWPEDGSIVATNITYRYRKELPDVIHGISFSIANREKVGVVGRTGSGKSTLTLGLLRILELSADPRGEVGNIKLSDVKIDSIGLHELRRRVTIIPQDPILFTGTIRSNIDPFVEYKDEDIVRCLQKVHIWDQIRAESGPELDVHIDVEHHLTQEEKDRLAQGLTSNELPLPPKAEIEAKLNFKVDDGGSNFSLGQRQLVCLARALIRKSKLLLMDEATANIDELTDYLIQKMIKTEFKDTTVFTIAHRLNTIIQYDKIIVLDHGNITEFGSPLELLDNPESHFTKLVNENGEEFANKMRYLAINKDADAIQSHSSHPFTSASYELRFA